LIPNRTITFRHHLFQPARNLTKATFQPCLSDSANESALAFDFKSPTPVTPTTDIMVTGEILMSPPAQYHNIIHSQLPDSPNLYNPLLDNINPSPLSSPLLTTLSSKDTPIQEIRSMSVMETNVFQLFHLGSEGGYASSPMANLMQEYQQERDDDLSTEQRTANLHAKKTLAIRDIIYLDNTDANLTLVNELLSDIAQVIGELQTFLEWTLGLIPERQTFFKVDPQSTFMNILSGATDLPQLYTAWFRLNK